MHKSLKNYSNKKVEPLKYLALGDSYTIGEGVDKREGFPYQLVDELQNDSVEFLPPTIIARTGWTTKELQRGIEKSHISDIKYDLVTLLIGVNNQYRGEKINNYRLEFSELLDLSIKFAGNNPAKVIIISIPDWGVTPFATKGNHPLERIKEEIDQFNQVNQHLGREKKVQYLEITQDYRRMGGLPRSLVADQLHPSGEIYKCWAKGLKGLIISGMDFGLSPITLPPKTS